MSTAGEFQGVWYDASIGKWRPRHSRKDQNDAQLARARAAQESAAANTNATAGTTAHAVLIDDFYAFIADVNRLKAGYPQNWTWAFKRFQPAAETEKQEMMKSALKALEKEHEGFLAGKNNGWSTISVWAAAYDSPELYDHTLARLARGVPYKSEKFAEYFSMFVVVVYVTQINSAMEDLERALARFDYKLFQLKRKKGGKIKLKGNSDGSNNSGGGNLTGTIKGRLDDLWKLVEGLFEIEGVKKSNPQAQRQKEKFTENEKKVTTEVKAQLNRHVSSMVTTLGKQANDIEKRLYKEFKYDKEIGRIVGTSNPRAAQAPATQVAAQPAAQAQAQDDKEEEAKIIELTQKLKNLTAKIDSYELQ